MLYYLTLVAVNAVESVEVSAFFFLACNLLWPCFLIETSDRFKWDSQIAKGLKLVTEVESSSREDGETRRDTSLLCYLVNNQPHSSIAVCRSPFHTKSDRIRTRLHALWRRVGARSLLFIHFNHAKSSMFLQLNGESANDIRSTAS